jgi:MFS family permease
MGLATLVIAIDFTAFSVALPSMERDLHASLATVQWVINAYAVVFGVVIVTGGRLADMLGRRTVFFIGAGIFAVFSLAGGLAPDAVTLIACRAVMGAGGALMWPAMMGMTYDLLPEAKAGLAGGLILGSAGFGNAVGPLLGGLLTSEFSWRWILHLNVLIAAAAVAATLRFIRPDGPRTARERLDYPGVAALTVGLVALLLALDFSSSAGWSSADVIALLAISPLALLAFALVERKAGADALLPPDVLSNPTFAPACIAVLLFSAVFFSILLYLPQFMVRDLGWSAVAAGAGLLPMMITFAVASLVAGSLYGRLGARVTATSGAAASRGWCPAWWSPALASDCSTRRYRPLPSPRSIRPGPAWRAASFTCARSAAGRSAWPSTPPSWLRPAPRWPAWSAASGTRSSSMRPRACSAPR